MYKIYFLFTLLVFITICSPSSQSSPSIINCPEHTINFEGICYQEIPNCQYYISGTKCIKCSQNFTIANYRCEKTDKIPQILLFTLLVKKNQNSKTLSRRNVLDSIDISNFNNIKHIVVNRHSNKTSPQNQPILKNFLKTPFNSYFGFTWNNSKNRTFLFQYLVDQNGQFSQLIADYYDPNLQNSWFGKINQKISEKYNTKLSDATLTRISSISKNLYKLHYYTDLGFHYIAFVQKIPYLEIKSLEEAQWKSDETDILNFLYSQHTFLVNEGSYELKKRENTITLQYEIKFKSGTKVVIQQFPNQKERVIFFCRQDNKTVSSNSKPVGNFQLFRNKEDEIVKKILNHIYSQFKFLKNSQITKIQYQIVSGTNFLIHLKDDNGNDEYICKVFYSLSSQINILEIYMNSVLIHTQPLAPLQTDSNYNFSNDPIFQKIIDFLVKSLSPNINKEILYVNKIKKTNDINTFFLFQIVYDQNTFVTVNYFTDGPKKGEIKVKDMVNKGNLEFQNIGDIAKIGNFLSGYRKWLNPLLITYMKQTKPKEYLLKAITGSGSYFFKLVDRNFSCIDISYYQLIDEKQHCITHSIDELQQFQFQQMAFIKGLISSEKIDPLSELTSLSEGIVNQKITYRILFSNPSTFRKSQVFASVEANGLQVNKIQPINHGFGLIIDSELYGKAVEKAVNTFTKELQNSKPILGMMNSSVVRLYLLKLEDLKKETVYLVQMDLSLQNPNIKTFYQQDESQNCTYQDFKSHYQLTQNQCEQKIKGCFKQIGGTCLMCEYEYSLNNNKCVNQCSFFM